MQIQEFISDQLLQLQVHLNYTRVSYSTCRSCILKLLFIVCDVKKSKEIKSVCPGISSVIKPKHTPRGVSPADSAARRRVDHTGGRGGDAETLLHVCLNRSLAEFTVFNTGAERSEQETVTLCVLCFPHSDVFR